MSAIPDERDLNTVTAADWRAATAAEQHDFHDRQQRRGAVSLVCLACGFPIAMGDYHCDVCHGERLR